MNPVVSISVITPNPGQLDAFMELQLAQHQRVQGQVPGLVGSRLFRALDGASAVLISIFDTPEAQQRFGESEAFKGHIQKVRPLMDTSERGMFEVAFATGAF